MSNYNIVGGATSQSIEIDILNTDGTDKTGVAYNTSGLSISYRRNNGSLTAITLASLASATATYSSGGFVAVSGSKYRLDLPNAAVASGASNLTIYGTLTGAVIPATTINLGNVPADVRGWLGSTPNGLSGGYVMVDVQMLQGDPDAPGGLYSLAYDYNNNGWVSSNVGFWLGSNVKSLTADNRIDVSVGSINAPTLKFPALLNANDVTGNVPTDIQTIKGQAVTAASGVTFPASIGTSTYAGADTTGTTTLLTRIPSALTITTGKVDVNDKTGFSLSASGLSAISAWTVNLTGNLSGSVGSVIGNVGGSIGSISGLVITGGYLPVDADAIAAAVNATEQQQQLAANAVAAKVAAESANDRIGDGSQDTDVARINSIPGALPLADEDRLMIEGLQDTANELAAVAPDHKPEVDAQGRVTTANPATAAPQINAEGNRVTGGKP